MKLQQLSVFLENKPGQLLGPCRLLGEAGVNIVSLSLADTQQFGILRLIVSDPARARAALEADGFVVNLKEVLAVRVPYRPGGLAQVLKSIEGLGMNVEYMYTLPIQHQDHGVLVFRFDDADAAVAAIEGSDLDMVHDHELERYIFGAPHGPENG